MFCGWDWGSTTARGVRHRRRRCDVKTWMVKHTETELAALFAELAELGDPAHVAGRDRTR